MAYEYLGAHREGDRVVFRVWAPHAAAVYAVGDFNGWDESVPLIRLTAGGVWEGATDAARVPTGALYKFRLETPAGEIYKADPYAVFAERAPGTASAFFDLAGYAWRDAGWLSHRARTAKEYYAAPMNIYEVHLGSWKRHEDGAPYTYRELAADLVPYVKAMGYTHVELMPVMEYPFDGSWGYQVTGYFAPTSRYGTPHDFMALVDAFHEAGVGVILDWVPAHFPKDAHGLYEFDGAPLYEYQGADRMENRGWGTRCFDVGREEVQSFLISNAVYWAKVFHADGLRVDAVSAMLYLDYGREAGEWVPNVNGGNENLEAVAFFQKLSDTMRHLCPDVLLIAEESTAWPRVTGEGEGSLGFSLKWNMGWMNDSLDYIGQDPLFRKFHHNQLTFSLTYAFSERYVLPISHDEVVHGKKSLLDKMPGTYEQKFAGMRAFLAYLMTHPGKKLLFMSSEIGQFREWDFAGAVEWFLTDYPAHAALQHYVAALNHWYLETPALWQRDGDWLGFCWLDADNGDQSVYSYYRTDAAGRPLAVVLNLTPVARTGFRQGLPLHGTWEVAFSTDEARFGGGDTIRAGDTVKTRRESMHGQAQSAVLTLPPLSAVALRCKRRYPVSTKAK